MGLLLAIYLMLSGDLTSAYFFDSQGHGNSAGLVFGNQLVLSALLYFKVHGDSSETSLLSVGLVSSVSGSVYL